MSRLPRNLVKLTLAVALVGPVLVGPISADAVSTRAPVKVLACNGATVSRPRAFVISCADANAALGATTWSTWTQSRATGTTRFALNLCNPYCAASKISYFPRSTVHLTKPVATKHGRLFSQLVVRYRLKGRMKAFKFSWKGDPSF